MLLIKRYAFILPLVIASIPMAIYPMVLMANVMSLAGERPKNPQPPTLQGALFVTFLYSSLLYPAPLGLSWCWAWVQSKKSALWAFLIATIPLIYLLLVVILLMTALGPAGRAQLFG
jgi:hypothetical protein